METTRTFESCNFSIYNNGIKYPEWRCNPLFPLEDAIGIAQHHNAVLGKAKQHVANDYRKNLQIGIDTVVPHITGLLRRMMLNATNDEECGGQLDHLIYCQRLIETICDAFEVRVNITTRSNLSKHP